MGKELLLESLKEKEKKLLEEIESVPVVKQLKVVQELIKIEEERTEKN